MRFDEFESEKLDWKLFFCEKNARICGTLEIARLGCYHLASCSMVDIYSNNRYIPFYYSTRVKVCDTKCVEYVLLFKFIISENEIGNENLYCLKCWKYCKQLNFVDFEIKFQNEKNSLKKYCSNSLDFIISYSILISSALRSSFQQHSQNLNTIN